MLLFILGVFTLIFLLDSQTSSVRGRGAGSFVSVPQIDQPKCTQSEAVLSAQRPEATARQQPPRSRTQVSRCQISTPVILNRNLAPQRTFGKVRTPFWLSQLGWGSRMLLESGGWRPGTLPRKPPERRVMHPKCGGAGLRWKTLSPRLPVKVL